MGGVVSNVFSAPKTWDALAGRMLKTLIISPKIFFGAFGWEAFALIATDLAGSSQDDATYFLLTGVGDAIGYFLAHMVSMHLLCIDFMSDDYIAEVHNGLLITFASGIVGGTLWGVWVWIAYEYLALTFSQAFFYIYAISFVVFFSSLLALREINAAMPKSIRLRVGTVEKKWQYDLTLSLSVASADAFFIACDSDLFPGSWFGETFNISSDTTIDTSLWYSGITAIIGFLIMQVLQNLFLEYTFVDDVAPPKCYETIDTMRRTMSFADFSSSDDLSSSSGGRSPPNSPSRGGNSPSRGGGRGGGAEDRERFGSYFASGGGGGGGVVDEAKIPFFLPKRTAGTRTSSEDFLSGLRRDRGGSVGTDNNDNAPSF